MQFLSILLLLPATLIAHGYLSSPPPRGFDKVSYQIDSLKSPNHSGLCRGEPPGQVTKVTPSGQLTLGLTITAPHTGPCEVSVLSYPDLTFIQSVASKYDCAAPGKVAPWTIPMPNLSGRKVLRWYWEGRHVSPGEPYEQCIDVDFGSGGGGGDVNYDKPAPAQQPAPVPVQRRQAPASPPPAKHHKKPAKHHKKPAKKQAKKPAKKQPSAPSYQAPSHDDTYQAPSNYGQEPSHDDDYQTPSGGGDCQHGTYTCTGHASFGICNYGTWITQQCAAGTKCTKQGGSIVCDWDR